MGYAQRSNVALSILFAATSAYWLSTRTGQLIDACNQINGARERGRERERPVAWPRTHDKRGVVFIHVVVDVVVAFVVAEMHLAWRWLATTMMTLHV